MFTTIRLQQLFWYRRVIKSAQEFQQNPLDEGDFPTISRVTTTLLTLLSKNAGIPPIQTLRSQEQFEKAFQKWSEGTSTSPSGRHLGHYKCLFADDGKT
jgi:hypothetical protein